MNETPTYKPDELAERRSNLASDCRLWTPKDALLACLRDIEKGEANPSKIIIGFQAAEGDGGVGYHYYAAGVTNLELAGLLAILSDRVTDNRR